MDMMSVAASSGYSSEALLSVIMLDKSMEVQKTTSAQLLEGLDVGTVAPGAVGSNIDVYA